jgi:hypothetical protein
MECYANDGGWIATSGRPGNFMPTYVTGLDPETQGPRAATPLALRQ